jgi:hypothetical protein
MAGVEPSDFDAPDETRTPDETTLATLTVEGCARRAVTTRHSRDTTHGFSITSRTSEPG